MSSQLVEQVAEQVKKKLFGETTGHDWWHIYRVWTVAKRIATKEGGDMELVELGALLHDIADWKFHADDKEGVKVAREILQNLSAPSDLIEKVCHIVDNVTFKGAGVKSGMESLEGKIVQDADRLDALGAMGIARAFIYGGHKGREIYNPDIKPVMHASFEEYKKNASPTINHFYEKILLLKDLMNTKTGKEMAEHRHKFIESFLQEFLKEWNAEE